MRFVIQYVCQELAKDNNQICFGPKAPNICKRLIPDRSSFFVIDVGGFVFT